MAHIIFMLQDINLFIALCTFILACASEALCDGTPNCDRCVDECHCNNPEIFIDKRDVGSSVREKQTSDFCRSECGEETAGGASCLIPFYLI